MNYEWFINQDGTTCQRYADSNATMVHIGTFGEKFAERILAITKPQRLTVYGDPDAAVRDALAGFGAVHMTQIGGFTR